MNTDHTLDFDLETMRRLGYQAVDMLVEHLASVQDKPATGQKSRRELEAVFREEVPREGMNPAELLKLVDQQVFPNLMHLVHPRFFAFVPGPGNYISALADFLVAGHNVFAGTWLESSSAAQIELVTIQWLVDLLGLPSTAGGLFVSGGSMANLTGIILAAHLKQQPDKAGVVYASHQTHASVDKAVKVFGNGRLELRRIEVDEAFRVRVPEVEAAIARDRSLGKQPICIVGNAGTTNTGAVDELGGLADLCERHDLWFHVDGAYGAVGVLDERHRAAFAGLERADSIGMDPHKWLFQPYEIGCILVKDAQQLKDIFYILPEYLKDVDLSEAEINYSNYGLQLTRSFRALKLWMTFKAFGLEQIREAIRWGIHLAELAEKEVRQQVGWEVVSPANLGVLTLRYLGAGLAPEATDALNQRIIQEMVHSGFAMVASTRLRDQLVIRLCTINPRTTEADIRETIRRLAALAHQLHTKAPSSLR